MHQQIGILVGLLIPICITVLVIKIIKFYHIPNIDNLRKILDESDIHSIYVETKFHHITKIEITKQYTNQPSHHQPKNIIPYEVVYSEWIGKFYSKDHDDHENKTTYSEEGQQVNIGDMVGYVFSLHLKNEVKSTHKGKIKKILLKDGDRVEFGQAIMQIETE